VTGNGGVGAVTAASALSHPWPQTPPPLFQNPPPTPTDVASGGVDDSVFEAGNGGVGDRVVTGNVGVGERLSKPLNEGFRMLAHLLAHLSRHPCSSSSCRGETAAPTSLSTSALSLCSAIESFKLITTVPSVMFYLHFRRFINSYTSPYTCLSIPLQLSRLDFF